MIAQPQQKSCQICKIFGKYGPCFKNYPPNSKAPGLANCQILVLESVDRPRHAPLVMDRNSKKWCFAPRSQKMCWKKTCVKMFGCLQAKMQFEEFAEMVKHRSEPCCPWKQWPFFICLHQQLVFTKLLSSLSESRIKKPRAMTKLRQARSCIKCNKLQLLRVNCWLQPIGTVRKVHLILLFSSFTRNGRATSWGFLHIIT